MPDVFARQQVSAESDHDLVVMRIGSHEITAPYQTVFEMLQHVLIAAKMASSTDGNSPKVWRDFVEHENDPDEVVMSRHFRKSTKPWNLQRYKIMYEGSLVVLCFNELVAKFHYADVLQFHTMVRHAAKRAKAWAGDSAKLLNIGAYLSTAEENYRLGLS